jgi:hypothetical protein
MVHRYTVACQSLSQRILRPSSGIFVLIVLTNTARLFYSTHVLNRRFNAMQFAIVLSLVLFISTALLLFQFLTGSLIGADDDATSWPRRTHRAH